MPRISHVKDKDKAHVIHGVTLRADFLQALSKGQVVKADTGEVVSFKNIAIHKGSISGYRKFYRTIFDRAYHDYLHAALEPRDYQALYELPYISKPKYLMPEDWRTQITEALGYSRNAGYRCCVRLIEAGLVFQIKGEYYRNPYVCLRGEIPEDLRRLSLTWWLQVSSRYRTQTIKGDIPPECDIQNVNDIITSFLKNNAEKPGQHDAGENVHQSSDTHDGSSKEGGEGGTCDSREGEQPGNDGEGRGGEVRTVGDTGEEAVSELDTTENTERGGDHREERADYIGNRRTNSEQDGRGTGDGEGVRDGGSEVGGVQAEADIVGWSNG